MNTAEQALREIVEATELARCPACGRPRYQANTPKDDFALCECGHIYIVENRKARNLTQAEKVRMRELNAKHNNAGREKHEQFIAKMIG